MPSSPLDGIVTPFISFFHISLNVFSCSFSCCPKSSSIVIKTGCNDIFFASISFLNWANFHKICSFPPTLSFSKSLNAPSVNTISQNSRFPSISASFFIDCIAVSTALNGVFKYVFHAPIPSISVCLLSFVNEMFNGSFGLLIGT